MAYTKTTWVDGSSPFLNQTNLNHAEQGIKDAHDALDTKEGLITAGTTSQYYRGDKTFQTLNKTAVGLANVDNVSDANKPVSTAQQASLDLKANITDAVLLTGNQTIAGTKTFSSPVVGQTPTLATHLATKGYVDTVGGGGGGTGAWGGITGTLTDQADLVAALALKAPLASPTFTGTVSGITKTMVGLGNVDNTSNATERAAAATLTNKTLDNTNIATLRSDRFTLQDSADTSKQVTFVLSGLTTAATRTMTFPDANSTLVGLTNTQTVTNKTMSGANNTFSNIPQSAVSTLTTDLAAKAPLASPTFTGTVAGITKTMVGLSNVDNTSDTNKPISTATQAALDDKQDVTATFSGSFADLTGTFNGMVDTFTTSTARVGMAVIVGYNDAGSAWPSVPSNLTTDANVGIHWVGGDEAHPPPTSSGPALWDRPVV